MKRFTLIILALFLLLINSFAYANQAVTKKELSVIASDKFNIKATLSYPKIKGQKEYKTVLLLHSLGTDSSWWGELPNTLIQNGYAVLAIDLRGHGKSIYNQKLNKVSWKNLTINAYKKYPTDIVDVINFVNNEYPKMKFFNDWAIVASDIGASTGIIASDMLNVKPKTIVLLSPVVKTKDLYIPVKMAQLDNTDFLSISCETDNFSLNAEKYLKKFAQKEFVTYMSKAHGTGMIMIKNDPEISPIITEWIKQYLKD